MVSSIKSTTVDSEEEKASYDQNGTAFLDTDLAPVSDNEDPSGNILSSSDSPSTEQKPEALPSSTSRRFNESEREHENPLRQENVPPEVDSIEQPEVTRLDTDWFDTLPAFLKNSESSILEDEKHVDLNESSFQVEENGATDATIEDVKSPPLAGPNVMNVILVAAECAPWSKTGILHCEIIVRKVSIGNMAELVWS